MQRAVAVVSGSSEWSMSSQEPKPSLNLIEQIIEEDNRSGKWGGRVHTRFPAERHRRACVAASRGEGVRRRRHET